MCLCGCAVAWFNPVDIFLLFDANRVISWKIWYEYGVCVFLRKLCLFTERYFPLRILITVVCGMTTRLVAYPAPVLSRCWAVVVGAAFVVVVWCWTVGWFRVWFWRVGFFFLFYWVARVLWAFFSSVCSWRWMVYTLGFEVAVFVVAGFWVGFAFLLDDWLAIVSFYLVNLILYLVVRVESSEVTNEGW